MKCRSVIPLAAAALVLGCCGCASIITSGDKKIDVSSNPPDATVTVYDSAGVVVLTEKTPAKIKLKKKAGYFKGADYRLVVQKEGFKDFEIELKHDINGWYFGNFAIGGLLGFLIVDPLTGGMWTIKPDKVDAVLSPTQTGADVRDGEIQILLKDQLTAEQLQHLQALN